MLVDKCVCCGNDIQEGRHVCQVCSGEIDEQLLAEDAEMIRWLKTASSKELRTIMKDAEKEIFRDGRI